MDVTNTTRPAPEPGAALLGGPHEPPRVTLPRSLNASNVREIVRRVARVLADSERTADIVVAEELTAQAQLRHLLDSGMMSLGEGPDIMADRPQLGDIGLEELRAMPEGSLGAAVASFFDRHGLDMKLYDIESEYTPDPELAYLMKRIRNVHDLWHVLAGFNIDGHEEILVHSFSLAQTGMPSSVALMALGSLKHMVLEARWGCFLSGMREAYRRGANAAPLMTVYWERHLHKPLEEVRRTLGIEPWTDEDRAATAPWRLRGPRPHAA